jgi:hypothetical protein
LQQEYFPLRRLLLAGVGILGASIFSPMAAAQTESVIFNFNGADGDNPSDGVSVDSNGDLIGTTYGLDNGSVDSLAFELAPPGAGGAWTETVLATIGSRTRVGSPISSLVPNGKGAYYGATIWNKVKKSEACPNFGGCGTIFKLKPPSKVDTSWKASPLYTFHWGISPVLEPQGPPLIGPGGVLYGTIQGGANGEGAVYALTPPGSGVTKWSLSVIYNFTCAGGVLCNGGNMPYGNLVQDGSGALYGVTPSSGIACPQSSAGCGTIFMLTPGAGGTWTESVIYQFTGGSDGGIPLAGLTIDQYGNLFGTTAYGGNNACSLFTSYPGCGAVFELAPDGAGGWSFATLYAFNGPAGIDAAYPDTTLIMDGAGALYGTSYFGGPTDAGCASGPTSTGCGTAFKLAPAGGGLWTETVLHSFTAGGTGADVYLPQGPLVLGNDGSTLYGTATNGVFQITQ